MEVEYEEYASTSTSKHHGWKLEVSRQHRERRELEDIEERLARVYARIDCGDDVADLTAPAAAARVREMDRLGIGSDEPVFLAYPERVGLPAPTDAVDDTLDATPDAAIVDPATIRARNDALVRAMPLTRLPVDGVPTRDLAASRRRPDRSPKHDIAPGIEPARVKTDREIDAAVADAAGNVPASAYTDLDQVD